MKLTKEQRELMNNKLIKNGEFIRFVEDIFKDDEEIMLLALKESKYKNPDLALYASERLRNNVNFIDKAMKINKHVFEYAGPNVKNNRSFVLKIIEENGELLKNASETLRNDEELVYIACSNYYPVIEFVNKRFREDKNLALKLLDIDAFSFALFSNTLQQDREVIDKAIGLELDLLIHLNQDLLNDKEFMLSKVNGSSDGNIYTYLGESLRNDVDIACASFKKSFQNFYNMSEELRSSKEFLFGVKDSMKEYKNFFPEEYDLLLSFLREEELNNMLKDKKTDSIIKKKI